MRRQAPALPPPYTWRVDVVPAHIDAAEEPRVLVKGRLNRQAGISQIVTALPESLIARIEDATNGSRPAAIAGLLELALAQLEENRGVLIVECEP